MSATVADVVRSRIDLLRDTITCLLRVQQVANEVKRETSDLRELIAVAGIIDDLDKSIERHQREMQRLSRSRLLKDYAEARWNP